MIWNVSIWIEGATRPLESHDFKHEAEADVFMAHRLAQIEARGWTHKVRKTVVAQS